MGRYAEIVLFGIFFLNFIFLPFIVMNQIGFVYGLESPFYSKSNNPSKIVQANPQQNQFVEEFEERWEDRIFEQDYNQTGNSSWSGSLSNGLLNLEKTEDQTFFDNLKIQKTSQSGTDYHLQTTCNNFTSATNNDCNSEALLVRDLNNGVEFINNYNFRKILYVRGSTNGSFTNFSLHLDLFYVTGTDDNTDIYLGTDLQTDFDDIRFTNNDGLTAIDYYTYDVNNGVNASVNVNITYLPAYPASAIIYLYWSYVSATDGSASSFDETIVDPMPTVQSFDDAATGGDWFDSYNYRKRMKVEGSASNGDLTNYTIEIQAQWGSGTDSGRVVYLNYATQADFDDVRFTLEDGSTEIFYFKEFVWSGINATFFVKIPSLLAFPTATYLYMYYGKALASDGSNLAEATTFYDDFESYALGENWYDHVDNQWQSNNGATDSISQVIDVDGNQVMNMYWTNYAGQCNAANAWCMDSIYPRTDRYNISRSVWNVEFRMDNCEGTGLTVCYVRKNMQFQDKAAPDSIVGYSDAWHQAKIQAPQSHNKKLQGTCVQGECSESEWWFDWQRRGGGTMADVYQNGWVESTGIFNFNMDGTATWINRIYQPDFDSEPYWYGVPASHADELIDPNDDDWFWENRYAQVGLAHTVQVASAINQTMDNVWGVFQIFDVNFTITSDSFVVTGLDGAFIGYVNATDTINGTYFYEGINKQFAAMNITIIDVLEDASFNPTEFSKLEWETSIIFNNLSSSDYIEAFLYDITDSGNIIDNYSILWSETQRRNFWNISSLPQYSKNFSRSDIVTNDGVFDLAELGNYWLTSRDAGNTVFGIGLQIRQFSGSDFPTENSSYLFIDKSWTFDMEIKGDIEDDAYYSYSQELDRADQFQSQVDFFFTEQDNVSWSENENQWQFQFAIQTAIGNGAYATHYIRSSLTGVGSVLLQWRDVSGIHRSYDTGVNLTVNKKYAFLFDVSRTDSSFVFTIIDSRGDQFLRPITWQNFTTDETAARPSFFTAPFLSEDWRVDTTPAHRKGVYFTLNATSTYVFTGESSIAVDRVFANMGLLDEEFYCDIPAGAGGEENCVEYRWGSDNNTLVDISEFSVLYDQYSNDSIVTQHISTVRDFRAFTGLATINHKQNINSSIEYVYTALRAYPMWKNGTEADPVELVINFVDFSYPSNNGHDLTAQINDETFVTLEFGVHKEDGTGAPSSLDVGFGMYWTERGKLAITMKAWDHTQDKVETYSIFGVYDPTEMTTDVNVVIEFGIESANSLPDIDTGFEGGFSFVDYSIQRGATLPFITSGLLIPDPEFSYNPPPKPNWFQNILNMGGNLVGSAFGFLGSLNLLGILDSILSFFDPLWTFLADMIDLFFSFIIDFVGATLIPFLWQLNDDAWMAFLPEGIYNGTVSFWHGIAVLINLVVEILLHLDLWIMSLYILLTFYMFSYPLFHIDLREKGSNFMAIGQYIRIWFANVLKGVSFFGITFPVPLILVWFLMTLLIPEANAFFLGGLDTSAFGIGE